MLHFQSVRKLDLSATKELNVNEILITSSADVESSGFTWASGDNYYYKWRPGMRTIEPQRPALVAVNDPESNNATNDDNQKRQST